MKRSFVNPKIFGCVLAAAAALFAACTDDLSDTTASSPESSQNQVNDKLSTVRLATFPANQTRVLVTAGIGEDETEIQPGSLRLVASVANPSKEEGFNFVKEEGGRYLSATCVFYDKAHDIYYATYHMQGNNYNTTIDNDIAGAIQTFTVNDGKVTLGNGFRASNPNKEDFDFNHLYFDNTDQRIIVSGHKWSVPSSWTGEGEYTGKRDNTRAIIGLFDPTTGTLKYSPVNTNEKEYDSNGKSLGYKDAGDVNCVARANDKVYIGSANGYLSYYVATRKGMAVLHADEANLFKPELNEDGTNYFVATPGSAKFVVDNPGTGSQFDLLYLAEDHTGGGESYTTSSRANIAHFQIQTASYGSFGYLIDPKLMDAEGRYHQKFDPQQTSILDYYTQTEIPVPISPVDGKNTLCMMQNMGGYECYAALGTGGLYYYNEKGEGVLRFDSRPVNCVCADENDDNEAVETEAGRFGHDGFLYVANGSKLTIFHRLTLEEVVSWNMPSKDENGNEIQSSANYIVVTKAPRGENGLCERTITVAFGQEGLKVFKFMPNTRIWK